MDDYVEITFWSLRQARRFFELTRAPALAGKTCYIPADYGSIQDALDYLGLVPKEIEWPDSRA